MKGSLKLDVLNVFWDLVYSTIEMEVGYSIHGGNTSLMQMGIN